MKIIFILSIAFAVGSLVVDWLQTLCIAREPDRFYEVNVLLGKHPSAARVSWYFGACVLLLLVGAMSAYWYGAYRIGAVVCVLIAVFECGVTLHNRRVGVRI
jgi:hypothetical protein